MFEKMRNVFGPVAVTVIIGAIAMVFVFFGIYNPRTTGGRGAGALAATVNGDAITMQEYAREYQNRTEAFQNMMKGKLDPSVLKQLRLGQQVIEDLIGRHLLLQEAQHLGMTAPDAEVREKIQEMPYFKTKEGQFDVERYNRILEMNHYTPAVFEDMVRDDILRARVNDFVRARAMISPEEVKDEFLTQEDRRQVDYVALTPEVGKKLIVVTSKEAEDAIKDAAGLGEAKALYERTKMTSYVKEAAKKPKAGGKDLKAPAPPQFYAFDEVKTKVAMDLVREHRAAEAYKINEELAKQIFEKAKSSPNELRAFAKSKGLELKTSDKFNRMQGYVAGIGEMPELIDDSFKEPSPLTQGPKLYSGARSFAVALNLKSFKPDLAELAKQQKQLEQSVLSRKSEQMFRTWMTDLRKRAKVSVNNQVTQPDQAESAED